MAYLLKAFTPGDPTITFHLEDGDELPKPGDTVEIEEESFLLGEVVFEKYGVATYKVVDYYPEEHVDVG